jgi:hypothetical protein
MSGPTTISIERPKKKYFDTHPEGVQPYRRKKLREYLNNQSITRKEKVLVKRKNASVRALMLQKNTREKALERKERIEQIRKEIAKEQGVSPSRITLIGRESDRKFIIKKAKPQRAPKQDLRSGLKRNKTMRAKVMIAVPNLGTMHTLLVERLLRWHTVPGKLYDQVALFAPRNIQPHDVARNACVREFLKSDATHLFFIDSDVVPPVDAIDMLLDVDVSVVTGAYPVMKLNPNTEKSEPVNAIFRVADKESGSIVPVSGEGIAQVDYCGGGCLMIERKVLELLRDKGIVPFKWVLKENGDANYSEDIYFCKQIGLMGIALLANFDVQCYHHKAILL